MKLTYPKHEHVSMNELIKNKTEPIAHVHYFNQITLASNQSDDESTFV